MKTHKKKIFCIEGDWNNNLTDNISIIGILHFLKSVVKLDFIHKTCSTKVELINRIEQFKKYNSYKILYLAFHGSNSTIHLNNEEISLSEIQDILKDSLKDKIIYFGSCKTLNVKDEVLSEFIKITQADGIIGYDKNVDFIEGTTIDLLFFNLSQRYIKIGSFKKKFEKEYKEISLKYGFKFFTN